MSRHIEDLHPRVWSLANAFLEKCKEAGLDVTIYFTFRTFEEQDELYAKGRTLPGSIVTNAKGGQSYHCYGLAWDSAPVKDGKIDWNDTEGFKKMGEIGKSVGMEWGGDFKTLKDTPHFQYTFGLTINDLLSGKRPPKTEKT